MKSTENMLRTPPLASVFPKPTPPVIRSIGPVSCLPAVTLPFDRFASNRILTRWLVSCPVEEDEGAQIASVFRNRRVPADSMAYLRNMKTLSNSFVVNESWPEFCPAVNLKNLGEDKPETRSLLVCLIRNGSGRIVRVCHGVAGMNVSARMWLSGVSVAHGEIVRLEKGVHSVVIEAYHGHRGTWLEWTFATIAPRFTEVTMSEIEEVHAWRLSEWKRTLSAARIPMARCLANIRIAPSTVRGTDGFFRVGQSVGGRWWMIDPEGRPVYHLGCTGLNAGGIGGRRASLPPVKNKTAARWVRYLREWGFNAMGAWTTSEFFNRRLPFAETIEASYVEPWIDEKKPDVFDPEWEENLDAKCRDICSPLRNNRMLIGYFLDNERGFHEWIRFGEDIIPGSPLCTIQPASRGRKGKNVVSGGLLQFCLSLGGTRHGSRRAIDFIEDRYGSLRNAGHAWGVPLRSPNDVRLLSNSGKVIVSRKFLKDHEDFVRLWVNQYYRVFINCIHRHDPNHLTLGMRHGSTPHQCVLEPEGRWADVVSRNNYQAEFYEQFDPFYKTCLRPVLNGEVSVDTDSFTLIPCPIEPPGGYDIATRQAIRAQTALSRICTHRGIVGYTKYRWHGTSLASPQLWADDVNRPNWTNVNTHRIANATAAQRAAERDERTLRPVRQHGQFILSLEDAVCRDTILPSARVRGRPTIRRRKDRIILALICNRGSWDHRVRGEGVRGHVNVSSSSKARLRMHIRLDCIPGIIPRPVGHGLYTVDVTLNGDKLEGFHSGTFNGKQVKGDVTGYLFRPITVTNL